jgi:hypothetical protein
MFLGLREIMGDHSLPNLSHLLRLFEVTKEIFDDAPDRGSGRITRFIFAPEVEAEMKAAAAGPQPFGEPQKPAAPPGPLAEMEELKEPPG